MKIIVLASQKGGVGKTTLAAHIAVAAEQSGDGPCVLIDTDPQASLAAWWNGREAQTPAFAPVTLKELSDKLEALGKAGYAYALSTHLRRLPNPSAPWWRRPISF